MDQPEKIKTVRERLLHFIKKYLRISVRQFETACGLSNGFVSKNRTVIRPVNVELISKRFPQINPKWLETGEGEMLRKEYNGEVPEKDLPYYDVDVIKDFDQIANDSDIDPTYYIHVSAFYNCDCAVPVFGRSMIPDINDGSMVAVKEVSIDSLLPGEAYVVVTKEFRTVKYVRICQEDPSKLRLVPRNLEEFDESLIDRDQIQRLFLIKGVITNKVI
ncbi:MAG: S24 family peptidase [Bacteroides sp.]|nr:S24 family peptidase [Bacteroides sp.]